MSCKKCVSEPVFENSISNTSLCRSCFIKYFERKAFKTISKYELVDDSDRIAIAVSGGKDSITVLHLLKELQSRHRKFELVALAVDEGIKGYRTLEALKKFCGDEDIELHVFKFEDEFGSSLDDALKKTDSKPCTVCGVLRRTVLNKKARELKANKLATGHNLDDEAQSVLMNYLKGNTERSIRLGPKTFAVKDQRFIQRIKPLYFLSEKEVATYAFLKQFPVKFNECPNTSESFRNEVREHLNSLEQKYPGTKNALVNSFLEMLPSMLDTHKGKKANSCKECGEPSGQDVCNTCKLVAKLN